MMVQKSLRTHRGVRIFSVKEEIPGSSLKELKDGTMVEVKPKYCTCYCYAGSYKFDTIEEAKASIDEVYNKDNPTFRDTKEWKDIMNQDNQDRDLSVVQARALLDS
jgi:hypothetical protein